VTKMSEEAPARSPIERQLNIGLIATMAVSGFIVLYAVVYVGKSWDGRGSEALPVAFVFLLLPGAVVFFTARSARRRLRAQAVSARLYGILAGIFGVLAGLPLVTTIFGLVSIVAGLFTLTAALLMPRARRTEP